MKKNIRNLKKVISDKWIIVARNDTFQKNKKIIILLYYINNMKKTIACLFTY